MDYANVLVCTILVGWTLTIATQFGFFA
jgi:hypothetical protein